MLAFNLPAFFVIILFFARNNTPLILSILIILLKTIKNSNYHLLINKIKHLI